MKESTTNIGQAADFRSPDARVSTIVARPGLMDPDGLGDVDDTPLLPEDADASSPAVALRGLFITGRRRLVPVRRTFVQLSRDHEDRTGGLAYLVSERQHVALDLLLLLIAFHPITGPDDPIPGKTWARLLSRHGKRRSTATVSRTWAVLDKAGFIRWTPGRPVHLLCEDRSGADYIHPGADRDGVGYFAVPRKYWLDGWHERLSLPAKAMLLILLAETNDPKTTTFSQPVERIAEYYGLSVATVRRGLAELSEVGLLGEKWQRVPAPRSPTGYTHRGHYWLKNPFSTQYREAARKADRAEAGRRAGTAGLVASVAPDGAEVKNG